MNKYNEAVHIEAEEGFFAISILIPFSDVAHDIKTTVWNINLISNIYAAEKINKGFMLLGSKYNLIEAAANYVQGNDYD